MEKPDELPSRTACFVLGGGPSGLVALKTFLKHGPDSTDAPPVLVEMEDGVGGTFRWRGYENAELVSSKQLTCFSDFRYPMSAPDHPSLPNYVQYLNDYATHFSLLAHIRLNTKVIGVERVDGKYKHKVTVVRDGKESAILAERLVITSGLHVKPNLPTIPGLTDIKDETKGPHWIHSSEYHSPDQLKGKKVLVLGAGETGMDLGYEAIVGGAEKVWMGIRGGFLSFPKVLNNFRVLGTTFDGNLPIDGLITNLFETAYVHPWVARSHLRWFVSDFVIRRVLWVLTGTTAGCNQWAGELPPERQGRAYVFLNKSAKAMQFINRPFRKMSWIHSLLFHYQDPPLPEHLKNSERDLTIHIVPFPSSFTASGEAVFPAPPAHRQKEKAWQQPCNPNLVVLCTGYLQDWSWLGDGYVKGPLQCGIRGVCDERDLSVAFIGFVRPGVGAIPPIAEMQSQLWVQLNQGGIPVPHTPENYHLLANPAARIQYGVDHSAYMSTLAKDIGSAPTLPQLVREHGWFIALVYSFGASFPTFYRLVGPYRSDLAPGIVKGELWETITRRGVLGNVFMGVIPMMFYALVNALALVIEAGWLLSSRLTGGKPPQGYFTQ